MPYKKIKILGRGSYGNVYLVKNLSNSDSKLYALKTSINNTNGRTSYENEIKLLQLIKHKNIISIIEFYKTRCKLNIIMEYAENGNLEDKIAFHKKKRIKFTDSEIKKIIMSTTTGIGHLHKNNIIHRDIKPSNILITKSFQIKIADFGVSRLKENNKMVRTAIGTPYYMAPEMLIGRGYSYEVDYWALGCIFYELVTLTRPFIARNIYVLSNKIKRGAFISSIIKFKYRQIIKGLINKNIRQRYGYKKIAKFFEIDDIVIPNIPKKNNLSLPKINPPVIPIIQKSKPKPKPKPTPKIRL